MINIPLLIKKRLNLPLPAGQAISLIPYSLRPGIGLGYRRHLEEHNEFERLDIEGKRRWVFNSVYKIMSFASNRIPFYRDFYKKTGLISISSKNSMI